MKQCVLPPVVLTIKRYFFLNRLNFTNNFIAVVNKRSVQSDLYSLEFNKITHANLFRVYLLLIVSQCGETLSTTCPWTGEAM